MFKLQYLFIGFLILFNTSIYGIRGLKINDFDSDTITTADIFHISGYFEPGVHIGRATLYYDTNGNGFLDADETRTWILKFKLIDGNFDDEDETVNTAINKRCDPITITGKFLLYAEDGNISDTVAIQVDPVVSSLSVSGKVTTPANTPNILAIVICGGTIFSPDTGNNIEYLYGDFTDSTGAYSIYLPEVLRDTNLTILAEDMVGAVPPHYMSSNLASIQVSEAETTNLDMFDVSTVDSTIVYGALRDDAGNTITDPVQIRGAGSNGAVIYGVLKTTDTTGHFRFTAPKGMPAFYFARTILATQFYPEYMNPMFSMKIGYGIPVCTLNITAYRTNDSICGTVYKDDKPYRYAQLNIKAVYPSALINGTYTRTYSDGHYKAYVSNEIIVYSVKVAAKSVPEGYIVEEGDTVHTPSGATGINFHLVKQAVEETQKFNKQSLSVHPNPFYKEVVIRYSVYDNAGTTNLTICDITGRIIKTLINEKKGAGTYNIALNSKDLKPGIYFVNLKIGNYKGTRKLILMK